MPEVEKFLPILIECANNKNYMGRLMIARSIQAFISFENITSQLKLLLNNEILNGSSKIKKNHNFAHGILLQVYHVLCNYLAKRNEILIKNVIFFIFVNSNLQLGKFHIVSKRNFRRSFEKILYYARNKMSNCCFCLY